MIDLELTSSFIVTVRSHQPLAVLEEPGAAFKGGKGNSRVLKDGPLKEAILKAFHTVDAFKEDFNTTTAAIQEWGGDGLYVVSFRFVSPP